MRLSVSAVRIGIQSNYSHRHAHFTAQHSTYTNTSLPFSRFNSNILTYIMFLSRYWLRQMTTPPICTHASWSKCQWSTVLLAVLTKIEKTNTNQTQKTVFFVLYFWVDFFFQFRSLIIHFSFFCFYFRHSIGCWWKGRSTAIASSLCASWITEFRIALDERADLICKSQTNE